VNLILAQKSPKNAVKSLSDLDGKNYASA